MRIRTTSPLQTRRCLGRRSPDVRFGPGRLSEEFSANQPLVPWQRWALFVMIIALGGGAIIAPRVTVVALMAILAIPFFCVVLLRTSALVYLSRNKTSPGGALSLRDQDLPTYSVLVPLYHEAEIIPDLLAALRAIDYPSDKLKIYLIVESNDPKTYAAVFEQDLPNHMRVIVVPSQPPQTKPQALNLALTSATGDCVVVYDAEDIPDPEQLRAAAGVMAMDEKIGCVQACLNVYNPMECFLTRGIV